MMQNSQGNAVPQNDGSHSRSDSGSYTYSTSEDEGPAPAQVHQPPPPPLQQQQQQHQQQQQQQQQPPPVTLEDPKAKAKAKKKQKEAAKEKKKKGNKKQERNEQMQEGDGEEGEGGARRKRGVRLPGSAKVQAIASMAATPVSADTQRVTIYLLFLFSFVNMLFIVLSCALSQLDISGKGCYTFWGFKANCDSTSYTIRASLLQNKRLKENLQAGAAMSILAVLSAVALFCVAWLLVIRVRIAQAYQKKQRRYAAEHGDVEEFHDLDEVAGGDSNRKKGKTASFINVGNLKWAAVGTLSANLVFELIAWAIIAGLYSARPGEDKDSPRGMTYGVGFGLGITAWICQLLMLVALIILV